MRVFMNKDFKKWSKKQGIDNPALWKAVMEMNDGLYDASLGGGVYKKRLAYGGKGRRSGVRTILAFRINETAFFIYGFCKNKQADISQKDEIALKALADIYLNMTHMQLDLAVHTGDLVEVKNEKINP